MLSFFSLPEKGTDADETVLPHFKQSQTVISADLICKIYGFCFNLVWSSGHSPTGLLTAGHFNHAVLCMQLKLMAVDN